MLPEKIRLLLVEPHPAVRRALTLRLHAAESIHVVASLARLEEAQTAVLVHKPDVVLLGLSGLGNGSLRQTVQTVAKIARKTAVIVLVPYAEDLVRELLLQVGVCRYLLKYINTTQLIREIESVAASNKTEQPIIPPLLLSASPAF